LCTGFRLMGIVKMFQMLSCIEYVILLDSGLEENEAV